MGKMINFEKKPTFEEIPSGLVPLAGTPFHKTSSDPVEPWDCERWPESPYCGGNPWSNTPIGIDAQLKISDCGIGLEAGAIIGFTKLPTHGIYWLNDDCKGNGPRSKEEKPQPQPVPREPWQPPPLDTGSNQGFDGIADKKNGFVCTNLQAYSFYATPSIVCGNGRTYTYGSSTYTADIYVVNWTESIPGQGKLRRDVPISLYDDRWCNLYFDPVTGAETDLYQWHYAYQNWIRTPLVNTLSLTQDNVDYTKKYWNIALSGQRKMIKAIAFTGGLSRGAFNLFYGWLPDIYNYLNKGIRRNTLLANRESGTTLIDPHKHSRGWVFSLDQCSPPDGKQPQAPLEDCNCMGCCASDDEQQEQKEKQDAVLEYLKKIDKKLGEFPKTVTIFDENEDKQEAQGKAFTLNDCVGGISTAIDRIEKISKIIGIDALPLTVPDTLIKPINNNIFSAVWDWITPDATRKITNLFEWHVWMLEQFSAHLGEWQLAIHVEDADATQEGNQSKDIAIPNLSVFCKESLVQQIQTYKILGLTLDVCLKTLTESSSTKQEVVKALMQIKEISDFLDFQSDEKSIGVDVQISVPEGEAAPEIQNDLHKYLQPGKTYIKYDAWDGETSLTDMIQNLIDGINKA